MKESVSAGANENIDANNVITQHRAQLRLKHKEQRARISDEQQKQHAIDVINVALANQLFINCKRVAVYLSQNGELDTNDLIEYLWAQKIEVYVPVLHPFCKGYLVFLRYERNSEMIKNKFSIYEPILDITGLCPIYRLDLIFTPLVAFDEAGNRLGMGGGYYDRTLQSLYKNNGKWFGYSNAKQTRVIGLAHDSQKTLLLPKEVWDIPLPEILTPSYFYRFNRT